MVDDVQVAFLISPNQKTLLHVAAEGGHVDTVGYLAEQAADTNMKDNWSGVSILILIRDCSPFTWPRGLEYLA